MVNEERQRFHGLFDTVAELKRMREFWRAGVDPPAESRTHATAWIPRMDVFTLEDWLLEITVAGGCAVERGPGHIDIRVGGDTRR